MMMVSAKPFTAVLLLLLFLFLFTAPTASQIPSPTIHSSDHLAPSPSPSSVVHKTLPHLSYLYFTFSIVYLSFLLYWISLSFKTNPTTFRKIHLLIAAFILLKLLSLISEAANVTTTHLCISVLISVFRLIIVMAMIGYVWHFIEPIMQRVDKTVLMVLIPLQLMEYIVRIVLKMMGETETPIIDQVLLLVDIDCGSFVILPIVCSMVNELIKGNIEMNKLSALRLFYGLVMLNLMINNGYDRVKASDHDYKGIVALEINTVVFYWIICCNFWKFFVVLHQDQSDDDDKAVKVEATV